MEITSEEFSQIRFKAFNDGFSGFVPNGMRYTEDAFIFGKIWTGGPSEKVSLEDVVFGSLLEGAMHFTTLQNERKKKKRRRQPPQTEPIIKLGIGAGILRQAEQQSPSQSPTLGPPANQLSDCVKKFLSKFGYFDRVVDKITFSTDGIPFYVPMAARAFVFGNHIYFEKGEFDQSNGVSDREMILLAHEARHVLQFHWHGKFTMSVDYLWESAKLWTSGSYFKGTSVAFHLSYYGNEYEADAHSDQDGMEKFIRTFGNPCR